ncbi:hypothetical protein M899_1775 [Bacteriovorax sp. BSW11_IV]|uniref:hypothetical protein n=1 Tax=Bacteriovorax sp. BSW11_IV TaxID=1353529 RepID=UPI00038A25BE|nr:hypothetical protein [Bacteriovorax sp. BSW11_IV]EQC49442.1 hypothetical protein M899_1775 [Bacteriovorax sp. BSW11_IV]
MKKFLSALLFVGLSSHAAVWQSTNEWDMQWEQKYADWMKSDNVYATMFVNKNSAYNGGSFDCADAAYALRAIFSFENSLPFAIKNPTGSNGKFSLFTNSINKFDYVQAGPKRVIAFLNYIADMVGSENLTRHDTYPIALDSIKAGNVFSYKIKARFGKWIRHVYNIKNVNDTGTFDLIYSTQAIRKAGVPLNYRKEKPIVEKPHDVWGFKAFIWPNLHGVSYSQYPSEMRYSTEQFELASKMDTGSFFKLVKNKLKIVDETDEAVLIKAFNNVCSESQARIQYVNEAADRLAQTGGKCMDYADYDAYSTPARDKALKDAFETLWISFKEIVEKGTVSPNSNAYKLANAVFWHRSTNQPHLYEPNSAEKDLLFETCPINYKANKSIDLAELFIRIRTHALSSHPNDILENRWGENIGRRTKCKAWY